MFDRLIAAFGGSKEAAGDHLDRNRLQAGKLPEHLPYQDDPHSPDCVVDSNNTTWIEDGPSFHVLNYLADFHPGDLDAWRGIPALTDQNHGDARSPLSDDSPGIGYQALYDSQTGELSPSSTADFASPQNGVIAHFERDVLPDKAISNAYVGYDLSGGENLQNVTRDAPPANTWPCENGEYVGGNDFHGIQPAPDPWHEPAAPSPPATSDWQTPAAADHATPVADWSAATHAGADATAAAWCPADQSGVPADSAPDWGSHFDSCPAGGSDAANYSGGSDSGSSGGGGSDSSNYDGGY